MTNYSVEMNSKTLYRLTKIGLDWYRKNRVLNRRRTSSQKYSRCIWEVVLGRVALNAADSKALFEVFLVDGHSPWYAQAEIDAEIGLLLEMGYITTESATGLDAIGAERVATENKVIKDCGRDWKKRNLRMRAVEDETLENLDRWFSVHPNWPYAVS